MGPTSTLHENSSYRDVLKFLCLILPPLNFPVQYFQQPKILVYDINWKWCGRESYTSQKKIAIIPRMYKSGVD